MSRKLDHFRASIFDREVVSCRCLRDRSAVRFTTSHPYVPSQSSAPEGRARTMLPVKAAAMWESLARDPARVSFGCSTLDEAFGGGVPRTGITEM